MTRRTRLTTRVALLGVVVAALVLTLVYPLRLYLAQRGQINQAAAANRAQQEQVAALQKSVARYDDPNWVRDQARLRLHYATPGEHVYVVPRTTAPRAGASPTATPSAGKSSAAAGSGLSQVRRMPATPSPTGTPPQP